MPPHQPVGSAEFIGAIGRPGQPLPGRFPQIAIAGRSNVGKSTLLNKLVGRKSLARTSKRPGRTQEINFFKIDDRFLLVDLPGYGFAQAPKTVRERWGPLIESYLSGTKELLGIVLLVDARHGLTPDDERMIDYLARTGIPTLFALTKIDKLNRSGQRRAAEKIRDALGIDDDQILPTSARTGEGVGSLWESLLELLETS
ncbi:MAG: ribosome biogenesis GTP-binding protein YihA/YsxC [Gemmatimonadota bacterium]|nr:ribosome biogenesis GTP-binding protein YihA/YsxC [Gemmatimonadota bacterium]